MILSLFVGIFLIPFCGAVFDLNQEPGTF